MNTTDIIFHAEQRVWEAIRNCDIEHLDYMLHDDMKYLGHDGHSLSKIMLLEKYRDGSFVPHSLVAGDPAIEVIGDVAISLTEVNIHCQIGDDHFDGPFRVLRVWKDSGSEWKIVAASAVRLR